MIAAEPEFTFLCAKGDRSRAAGSLLLPVRRPRYTQGPAGRHRSRVSGDRPTRFCIRFGARAWVAWLLATGRPGHGVNAGEGRLGTAPATRLGTCCCRSGFERGVAQSLGQW